MLGLVPGGSESKLLPDLAAGRLVAFRLPDLADVLAFFAAFRLPDLADVPAFFAACRLPDLADVLAFFAAFRFPDLAAGRLVACRLPDLADVLAFFAAFRFPDLADVPAFFAPVRVSHRLSFQIVAFSSQHSPFARRAGGGRCAVFRSGR